MAAQIKFIYNPLPIAPHKIYPKPVPILRPIASAKLLGPII